MIPAVKSGRDGSALTMTTVAGSDDEMMSQPSGEDGVAGAMAQLASQANVPSQGPVIVCSQGKRRGAAVRSPIEQVKRAKINHGRMAQMRNT